MIQDQDCNTVYLAEQLGVQYPDIFHGLIKKLRLHGYTPHIVKSMNETKVGKELSIWLRDYMPIQVGKKKFVCFEYSPDYLDFQKYYGKKPDGGIIAKQFGHLFADYRKGNSQCPKGINIDGGNITKLNDYIVMMDKFIDENPGWRQNELINELKNIMGTNLIILPWDKREAFGHTDGIVRYAGCFNGKSRVIINQYGYPNIDSLDRFFNKRFENRIKPYFDEVCLMQYECKKEECEYRWAYINWLQLENVIILPKFGDAEENDQAVALVEKYMPQYKGKIEQVEATDLVKTGGGFNCASWTTKE